MGKWSHSAVLNDGWVYDTTLASGVRKIEFDRWLDHYPKYTWVMVDVPDEPEAMLFLETQIGKPYDWTALFGLLFQRNWQEEDSWFCSELVEAALVAGGRQRFRDSVSRVTPQQSWSVL